MILKFLNLVFYLYGIINFKFKYKNLVLFLKYNIIIHFAKFNIYINAINE